MSFRRLQQQVIQAEAQVQDRLETTAQHWQGLVGVWREGLTPSRVVLAGLLAGVVMAQFKPGQALKSVFESTRWLRALTTLTKTAHDWMNEWTQVFSAAATAQQAKNTATTAAASSEPMA